MMTINDLAREINTAIREKGFWDSKDDADGALEVAGVPKYASVRKSVNDAFIAQKLALIGSEVGEAVEAMRKPNYADDGYGKFEKDSFADELADTIIRILDLCGELNIDIESQIAWKLVHSASRPAKHGKEF